MRFLVTGGAGYIGSHTVQLLLEKGHSVSVLDNFSMGHEEALPQGVDVFRCDLRSGKDVDGVLESVQPQVVIHMAALALVSESMQHPERYFDVNVSGGLNLLQSMLRSGVKRILFSSTCASYGVPDVLPIPEEHPQRPINAYGASKHVFEQILSWFEQRHGFEVTIFRYFNAAGCWGGLGEDHTPETHLIPNVLRAALGINPRLEVYGTDYPTPDGTCLRDFVHVRDVADAHVRAAESGLTGRFNLGCGRPISVREVIQAAERVTGREIPVKYLGRREGDPPALYASSEKFQRASGWRPDNSELEPTIRQAWEWMLAHPAGYLAPVTAST